MDKNFKYAVYCEDELLGEYDTLKRAKEQIDFEIREGEQEQGMTFFIIYYREVLRIKG